MAINTLPVQFERNFKGSFIIGEIFTSLANLNGWLTNPTRYAGQRAVLVDSVGGTVTEYVLNEAEDAWIPSGSGGSGGGISLWTASTVYAIDDVIIESTTLNVYICTTNHTSDATDFFTDIANWDEVSKKGLQEWTASTAYVIGENVIDPVSLQIYKCNTAHTSDATAFATDIANWDKVSKPDSTDEDITTFEGTAKEIQVGKKVFNALGTGVQSFAGLSINASTTTFDVGAIEGHIVDTQGDAFYPISFAGQTNISPATANGVTYVFIDNTGAVVTQTTQPTPDERRDNLWLGRAITIGGTVIQVQDTPSVFLDNNNQLYDLAESIGIFNASGNTLSPNGANLSFDKSAGLIFSAGANFTTDPKNPHEVTISGTSPTTFAYITQTAGSTGSDVTLIDPANYDLAGTVTAVPGPASRATIQRVYLFPSGNVRVAYGQTVYTNIADALAAISTGSFVGNPAIDGNGVLIGFIVVRKTATDLSLDTDAVILKASKFGEGGVGASGLSTSTMQNTYDNSSQPQIVVNSTQGAIQVRDNATPIADSLFEVQDNAGTTNYLDVKANSTQVTDADGTTVIRKEYTEIYREDFKVNDDIDAGVTLAGTGSLSMETANPISGFRSLNYAQAVGGSAGSFIDISSIPVDETVPGNLVGLLLDLKGSAELVDGYKVSLYESADDATYTEVAFATVTAKTTVTSVQVTGQILSASQFLGLRVEVLVASASHQITVDNILFKTRPLPIVEFNNITDTVTYTPTLESSGGGAITLNATGSVAVNGTWARDGDRMKVYISFRNGSGGVATGTAGNVLVSIPSGYAIDFNKLADSVGGLNNVGQGEFFGPEDRLIVGAVNATQVRFTMNDGGLLALSDITASDLLTATFEVPIVGWSATGRGVVTEGKELEQFTNWETFTPPILQGLGTITSSIFLWRRNGSDLEMKGAFITGTVTASELQLGFPTEAGSITVDSRITSRIVAGNWGNSNTSADDFYPNCVAGDNFINLGRNTVSAALASSIINSSEFQSFHVSVPIEEWSSTIGNVSVISPFSTGIANGQEYVTDKVIGGKKVYATRFELGSDLSTTTTLATISSGLTPVNATSGAANTWVIDGNQWTISLSNLWYYTYNDSTGAVQIVIAGNTVRSGSSVTLEYTK